MHRLTIGHNTWCCEITFYDLQILLVPTLLTSCVGEAMCIGPWATRAWERRILMTGNDGWIKHAFVGWLYELISDASSGCARLSDQDDYHHGVQPDRERRWHLG
jgi:hypothetical protein